MRYHPTVEEIKGLLVVHGCWFEIFEHEPVRTSEEAAKIRTGYSLSQGAKALIVRVKVSGGKKFVMLVVPGDRRFDRDKVRAVLGAKEIRFATEAEVADITGGIQVGGVPPFGNLFGLEVVVDPGLLENEKIIFNAGDKRVSLAIKSADYLKLVSPRVEMIA